MKKTLFLLTALFSLVFITQAGAYVVDFTSSAWSGISGSSYTVGNVTLSTADGAMTWNGDGPGSSPNNGDGIGIDGSQGNDADEINFGQTLTVSFANAVYVSSISFLDFFDGSTTELADWGYITTGGTLSGGQQVATATDSIGWYTFSPGIANPVTGLYFTGVDINGNNTGDDGDSDFSLAKIEVSNVPIPGAVWLLGSGLLGLVGIRRRKA